MNKNDYFTAVKAITYLQHKIVVYRRPNDKFAAFVEPFDSASVKVHDFANGASIDGAISAAKGMLIKRTRSANPNRLY